MTYEESIEYIHSIRWLGSKPGLSRIRELCEKLRNPQNSLKFVHVTGTNGKGSFCSMLSHILTKSGYKVGLFTSPYIYRFNERIQINNEPISDNDIADITNTVKQAADTMKDQPTEFELITAIGFEYFKNQHCDIVILEVGMGGEFDSTNIINSPIMSVITPISLDHSAILGSTVEEIAKTKSKIIKDNSCVLIGNQDSSVKKIIKDRAEATNSDYYETDYSTLKVISSAINGITFDYNEFTNIFMPAIGDYQPQNAACAITAAMILKKHGFNITNDSIYNGFSDFIWKGRFEVLSRSPLFIFDGGHNPDGFTKAISSINRYFSQKNIYILMGVMADKDYNTMLDLLSSVKCKMFAVTPNNPRSLPAKELSKQANEHGIDCVYRDTINSAITEIFSNLQKDNNSVGIAIGSFYMYKEVYDNIQLYLNNK